VTALPQFRWQWDAGSGFVGTGSVDEQEWCDFSQAVSAKVAHQFFFLFETWFGGIVSVLRILFLNFRRILNFSSSYYILSLLLLLL
jgi:hypothetical protein